jgi:hypothetical protein
LDADGQLGGDLGVGTTLRDQGDQFPVPGGEVRQGRRGGWLARLFAHK